MTIYFWITCSTTTGANQVPQVTHCLYETSISEHSIKVPFSCIYYLLPLKAGYCFHRLLSVCLLAG